MTADGVVCAIGDVPKGDVEEKGSYQDLLRENNGVVIICGSNADKEDVDGSYIFVGGSDSVSNDHVEPLDLNGVAEVMVVENGECNENNGGVPMFVKHLEDMLAKVDRMVVIDMKRLMGNKFLAHYLFDELPLKVVFEPFDRGGEINPKRNGYGSNLLNNKGQAAEVDFRLSQMGMVVKLAEGILNNQMKHSTRVGNKEWFSKGHCNYGHSSCCGNSFIIFLESTLSVTLRFTYSKALRKWPIGDLAFGINFLLKGWGNLHVAHEVFDEMGEVTVQQQPSSRLIPHILVICADCKPLKALRIHIVLWVGFDRLGLGLSAFKRVLLLSYANGFQVLDVENASNFCKLVLKRDDPITFLQMQSFPAKSEGHEGFRPLHPLLLVVACDELKRNWGSQGMRGVNIGYGPMAVEPRWLAYASNNSLLSNTGLLSPQGLNPQGVSPSTSPRSGSLMARYAMESSKQLAAGLINLGDGSNSSISSNSSWKVGRIASHMAETNIVAMVVVKDFGSRVVVSQFRGHTSPISAVCFDLSGTLLVTTSIHGKNINIFRIMPSSSHNGSFTQPHDSASSYMHIYKFHRGMLLAVRQDICFSHYSHDLLPAHMKGNALENLLVYTPCGHTIQYELLPSMGGESNDAASIGPGSSLHIQDVLPNIIPQKLYTLEQFLWAGKLWYSNIMKKHIRTLWTRCFEGEEFVICQYIYRTRPNPLWALGWSNKELGSMALYRIPYMGQHYVN